MANKRRKRVAPAVRLKKKAAAATRAVSKKAPHKRKAAKPPIAKKVPAKRLKSTVSAKAKSRLPKLPKAAKQKAAKRRQPKRKAYQPIPLTSRHAVAFGQAAVYYAKFVEQKRETVRLETELARVKQELEESKQREFEAAERAAIQAETAEVAGGFGRDESALYDALRWLRQDSSPARHPSILRHMIEAAEWRRQLNMLGHSDPDSPEFKKLARKIARENGVAVKEVYSLWWSP
jgi:hypothetical protein